MSLWSVLIPAAVSLFAGKKASDSATKAADTAADAQIQSTQMSIDFQKEQFEYYKDLVAKGRKDYEPFLNAAQTALPYLMQYAGIPANKQAQYYSQITGVPADTAQLEINKINTIQPTKNTELITSAKNSLLGLEKTPNATAIQVYKNKGSDTYTAQATDQQGKVLGSPITLQGSVFNEMKFEGQPISNIIGEGPEGARGFSTSAAGWLGYDGGELSMAAEDTLNPKTRTVGGITRLADGTTVAANTGTPGTTAPQEIQPLQDITQSELYKYPYEQEQKALERMLAARGLQNSSAGLMAGADIGGKYATQALNQRIGLLQGLVSGGSQFATAGSQGAQAVGNAGMNLGSSVAQGYQNNANAIGYQAGVSGGAQAGFWQSVPYTFQNIYSAFNQQPKTVTISAPTQFMTKYGQKNLY